jgi:4-hydroxybenzoate polyprenyltransferase
MDLSLYDWYKLTKINRSMIAISPFLLGMLTFSSLSLIDILPILTIVFVYCASSVVNDMADIDIDTVSNSKRPFPSKKLSFSDGYLIIFILLSISLIFAYVAGLLLNKPYFIAFAIIEFCIGIVYSLFTSRNFISASATLATSHIVIPFLSAVYLFGGSFSDSKVVILSICLWLFYSIISNLKDFKDIDGDKRAGRLSIPMLLDLNFGKKLILVLLIFTLPITIIARVLLNSSAIGFAASIICNLGFLYLGFMVMKTNKKEGFELVMGIYRCLVPIYVLSFLL